VRQDRILTQTLFPVFYYEMDAQQRHTKIGERRCERNAILPKMEVELKQKEMCLEVGGKDEVNGLLAPP